MPLLSVDLKNCICFWFFWEDGKATEASKKKNAQAPRHRACRGHGPRRRPDRRVQRVRRLRRLPEARLLRVVLAVARDLQQRHDGRALRRPA